MRGSVEAAESQIHHLLNLKLAATSSFFFLTKAIESDSIVSGQLSASTAHRNMIFEPAERVLLPTKDLLSYIFDDPPYDQDQPVSDKQHFNFIINRAPN
jgi:hypothetical protein